MKKIIFGIVAFAGIAYSFSLNVDPNQTGSINISNSVNTPTQIFTKDFSATRTCVVNTSTTTVFIVGYSTTSALSISTNTTVSTNLNTGSFFIQGTLINGATVAAQPFCFDGNNDSYTGPMWAVASGSGATIQRIRMH